MNAWKPLELALAGGARILWPAFQAINRRIDAKPFHPAWAPAPLLSSRERTKPPLGWPRTTDSLCPTCVREARARILAGEQAIESLVDDHVGEIKAQILERDGKVIVEKTCPRHGTFVDTLAVNPAFLRRLESLFPGRDFPAITDTLHNHGTSSIRYGRGAVLTIDLTNRCNMMCDPCFMDANQVGYVHELTFDDVRKLLDDAISIKPRRQMTVQFSGGEPTISPIFLEAVRYARAIGYFSVQAATNGIRFAQDPEFARQAHDAGMRIAYLQFDGIGEDANAHRKVGNLFDVKLRAIENLHAAGIDICLVVTIVNTVNDHQVGPIVKFALQNCDKVSFVSFQPVSFTGRDEAIGDDERHRKRYTLSHLAEDMKRQTGVTDPLRDWFPLSAASTMSQVTDLMRGPGAQWGSLSCGCHPDCGVGMGFMVSKKTKEWAPLSEFLNVEQVLSDATAIADAARGRALTIVQSALSLLRNYHPLKAPAGFRLIDLLHKFDKQSGGQLGGRLGARDNDNRKGDEWLLMFVAGMWFQDLWTYDFRRTEMCIIPYATQMGEISFCAYNTGVGWRQIVENMYQSAKVADWYREHGRHPVYANLRKIVPMPAYARPVALHIPRDGRLVQWTPKAVPGPASVAAAAAVEPVTIG
ncbi:MAG TPA: radical SAM protein [Vicinamibacterales bacterium]|nr:radical SAM protein [Vicinamibacterales bacterium]